MDGSAVFLAGFTSMLAQSPNLQIDLILANPPQRDLLIKPLLDMPNVNVISPYDETELIKTNPSWLERKQFKYDEAKDVIEYYWNKSSYEWFFIRGMEVSEELLNSSTDILSSSLVYVTGITRQDQVLSVEKERNISLLFDKVSYLLCQTDEMRQFISNKFPLADQKKFITLNPMIPDTSEKLEEVFTKKDNYSKLCYTGKFDVGWNSVPIISSFKELLDDYPHLSLDIAGDKFNMSPDHPDFVKEMRYLLTTTPNLNWYGAVSRDQAREIITDSDIGITWRHKSMDNSLELSTKLLEYGSLGKAVIMNPTPMHKKLFGNDYPLYAETVDDFIDVIKLVQSQPEVYERAAARMFNVSQQFTYKNTLKKLLPFLNKEKYNLTSFFYNNGFSTPEKVIEIVNSSVEKMESIELKKLHSESKSNHYSCIIGSINSFKELVEYFQFISSQGEVIDYYLVEKHAICLILCSSSYQSNFNNALNSKAFEDLLDKISFEKLIQKISSGELQNIYGSKNIVRIEANKKQKPSPLSNKPLSSKETRDSENKIKALEQKILKLEKRNKAFTNSKLGKLTVMYWELRNKRRKKY